MHRARGKSLPRIAPMFGILPVTPRPTNCKYVATDRGLPDILGDHSNVVTKLFDYNERILVASSAA